MKSVDIIVSCYNEEDNIYPFFNECTKYLTNNNIKYRILFCNDGSVDKTYDNILKLKKENITKIEISCVSLVKNSGHEAAMCVGLDNSVADYLIFIDCDMQHPVSKINEIISKLDEGYDCILLKRINYGNVSVVKKFLSFSFYYLSRYILRNNIEPQVSDFFAITNKVASLIKENYNTKLRFLRMFAQKESKNSFIINYECVDRIYGKSKFNYMKLIKLAIVSELSRFKIFRNMFIPTDAKPIYKIDQNKTFV